MRKIVTPVSRSPSRIAAETGLAPRQRGRRLVWRLTHPYVGSESSAPPSFCPKPAVTITSGVAEPISSRASRPLTSAVLSTGRFTRGRLGRDRRGLRAAPAPRLAVGLASRRARAPCPRPASERSAGTANSGLPMNTMRGPVPRPLRRASRPSCGEIAVDGRLGRERLFPHLDQDVRRCPSPGRPAPCAA